MSASFSHSEGNLACLLCSVRHQASSECTKSVVQCRLILQPRPYARHRQAITNAQRGLGRSSVSFSHHIHISGSLTKSQDSFPNFRKEQSPTGQKQLLGQHKACNVPTAGDSVLPAILGVEVARASGSRPAVACPRVASSAVEHTWRRAGSVLKFDVSAVHELGRAIHNLLPTVTTTARPCQLYVKLASCKSCQASRARDPPEQALRQRGVWMQRGWSLVFEAQVEVRCCESRGDG